MPKKADPALARLPDPLPAELCTPTADGYVPPSPEVLRGAALALEVSVIELCKRLGISPRTWRSWTAPGGATAEAPFAIWRVLRLWLQGQEPELPPGDQPP